jgi:protein-tyrosine phosphatase
MMGHVTWDLAPGVVEFPDRARVSGRGLRQKPDQQPLPEWGLYLLARAPHDFPWPSRWLRWRDFWLPSSTEDARSAFEQVHELAVAGRRVEIACAGGIGRTGTALACIAQLAGVSGEDATEWTRARYHAHAVETPWQRRYVRRFSRRTTTI